VEVVVVTAARRSANTPYTCAHALSN
jgi:hypothetical protein